MTTVRDLLDVAAAELGATSAHLAAGELPRPGAAAEGWSLLLPAAQHLTLQTVGPWSKVNARLVRQLSGARPPLAPAGEMSQSSVCRAAQAMGAAGDLLSTRVRTGSAVERQALLGEGLRLLAASAEVTLHGVGHDLRFSSTIASAARVGELARTFAIRVGGDVVDGPLSFTAAPTPSLPRSHPGGPLAHAVHTWSQLALRLAEAPTLSSQDLRGTAVVSAHLLGCVQHLTASSPPDATAVPSLNLRRWIRQWQDIETLLGRFAMVGPTNTALAQASWDLVTQVKVLARPADSMATGGVLSPYATSALSRSIVDAVGAVAAAHARGVDEMAAAGRVFVHADRARWSVQHPLETPRAGWTRAHPDQARALVLAYQRLMTTRDPRAEAVGRPRRAFAPLPSTSRTTPGQRR